MMDRNIMIYVSRLISLDPCWLNRCNHEAKESEFDSRYGREIVMLHMPLRLTRTLHLSFLPDGYRTLSLLG
jgi:hypothetical protein